MKFISRTKSTKNNKTKFLFLKKDRIKYQIVYLDLINKMD